MSSFLYPTLPHPTTPSIAAEAVDRSGGVATLLLDLAATVRATWTDADAADIASVAANRDALRAAADLIAAATAAGGRVLVMGNGGSACDGDRLVRILRTIPTPVPARSLLDPVIVSALANDVGASRIFSRQVETYARAGDVVVVFTTSGASANVIDAVVAAKHAGVSTIAFAGYHGGSLRTHSDVDVCVTVESSSVHRIQETQGALVDALVDALVERLGTQAGNGGGGR